MANIIDYADRYGSSSFNEIPFNEFDGLIMSEMSYIHWDGIVPGVTEGGNITLGDAVNAIRSSDVYQDLKPEQIALLDKIADSKRYSGIQMSNYADTFIQMGDVSSQTAVEQFSAVTFSYDNADGRENYLAYRGTDGTLEGWNEDFNLAFDMHTEAQKDAAAYADAIAGSLDGSLRMGGHSKGGNLSNYSYLYCSDATRARVDGLYAYDAPGFRTAQILSNPYYQQMTELLKGNSIAPYDSVIGLLLDSNEYSFVATDRGIFEDHDAYSWQIDVDNMRFVPREQSEGSRILNHSLDIFLGTTPTAERKEIVEKLFHYFYTNDDIKNFDDVLGLIKGENADILKFVTDFSISEGVMPGDLLATLLKVLAAGVGGAAVVGIEDGISTISDWMNNAQDWISDKADALKDYFADLFGPKGNPSGAVTDSAAAAALIGAAAGMAAGGMIGGEITVDVSTLLNTADLLAENGENIHTISDEMLVRINQLSDVWDGSTAMKYITRFSSFGKTAEKLNKMITEHVTDLKSIADNYQRAEQINTASANDLLSEVIF